ncbi:hypothetical protein BRD00_14665 [Halobacteriales archaeon QS_8_69_26]|nr:MAG: hypothetical protein BRD00_14665 [Halobacteriales archaeon QS_8_69_26]
MSWSPTDPAVRPSSLAALAVALLLVTAGCSGSPDATPEPTPEPTTDRPPTDATPTTAGTATSAGTATPAGTDATTSTTRTERFPTTTRATTGTTTADPDEGADRVRVENGTLPVNATLVFRRVQALLGVDADPPVVRVNPSGYHRGTPDPDPFAELVGLARPAGASLNNSYAAAGSADSVILLFQNTTTEDVPPEDLAVTLAHEFVHVIQDQRRDEAGPLFPEELDADVRTALTEGGAVYVTQVYADRYGVTNADGNTPIDTRARHYRTRPPWILPVTAEYYFGARYLDRRLDGPGELWGAYADPPATMEGVIHGPGVEPAHSLSVTADAPGWDVTRRGRQGEHVLRAALRSELPREDAAAAATGWGNDSPVAFAAGNDAGYAWVVRWDDADEADEFEDAARRFADRRGEAVGGSLRVTRPSSGTVVLLMGPEAFVGTASVTASDGNVTVTADPPGRVTPDRPGDARSPG